MRRTVTVLALGLAVVPLLFGCAGKNFDTLIPDAEANYTSIKSFQETRSLYVSQAGTDVHTARYAPRR